ncbi:MAG: hypothetical protein IPI01_02905 [Ignavibacteriae bacterium]|nr:hypothetical protein [Ignavibacteriota bacterium]
MDDFRFCTKLDQTLLLGMKARSVHELLQCMRLAPRSSIYFHTHRFLLTHNYLTPEPSNDFAYWVTEVLNDHTLGEQLSNIDIIGFPTVTDLQRHLVSLIERHLDDDPRPRQCVQGEEFHFMASRLFVLQTPLFAHTLSEFAEHLAHVSVASLYYHVFDARLRLDNGENDFSQWFRSQSLSTLADAVLRLDPYTCTLEGLRKRLLVLIGGYDKH